MYMYMYMYRLALIQRHNRNAGLICSIVYKVQVSLWCTNQVGILIRSYREICVI